MRRKKDHLDHLAKLRGFLSVFQDDQADHLDRLGNFMGARVLERSLADAAVFQDGLKLLTVLTSLQTSRGISRFWQVKDFEVLDGLSRKVKK